jgi:hypothetical protein
MPTVSHVLTIAFVTAGLFASHHTSARTAASGAGEETLLGRSQPTFTTTTTAQSIPDSVTVALTDSFPDPRMIGVVRRTAGRASRSIVAIRRSALRPEVLLEAARIIELSINRHGENPSRPIAVPLQLRKRYPPPTPAARAWAQNAIESLLTATLQDVPELGRRPAVAVSLPSR